MAVNVLRLKLINLCLRMLWLPHRNLSLRFMYRLFSVVYSDNSTKDLSTVWGKFLSFKSDGTYSNPCALND